jgi:hypothetical protein
MHRRLKLGSGENARGPFSLRTAIEYFSSDIAALLFKLLHKHGFLHTSTLLESAASRTRPPRRARAFIFVSAGVLGTHSIQQVLHHRATQGGADGVMLK